MEQKAALKQEVKEVKPEVKQALSPAEELAKVKAELEALKKSQENFEEEAVKRAANLAGVDMADMIAIEAAKKAQEDTLEYDIGNSVVTINGVPFTGSGRAKRGVVETIVHAAAAARHQRMKELIGNQYQLEGGLGGPIRSRLIQQLDAEI